MNKVQVLLLLIMVLAISACQAPQKVEPKVKFELIMDEYFEKYKPKLNPIMAGSSASMAEILISKENLTHFQMIEIKKKMKISGWKEVEDTSNYAFFCLNTNQAISILYPELIIEKNSSGVPIDYDDVNSWSIVLFYSSAGLGDCINFGTVANRKMN